ncbi:MAG: hypothetical protein RLZZ612_91 [Pseudomonadota bacterium]
MCPTFRGFQHDPSCPLCCRVAVGDGGHPELLRAMRVHANFAEYVPLSLGLILVTSALELLRRTLWVMWG